VGQAVEELLIEVRRDDRAPLHRQIESAIRDAIRTGRLRAGGALPPSRRVAAQLGVSRGVVVEAYRQLVAEGYLTSRPGGYTTVAAAPLDHKPAPRVAAPAKYTIDFGYGRADVANFPRHVWLRSLRRVLITAPNESFGYASGAGVPELREALADYLNRVRGTHVDPADVVVCNGYAQGITIVLRVLAARGARRLAVEDPCSDEDASLLGTAAGLEVVGVPVDDDGIRVDALDRSGADVVVLTPSHQWPVGGVLSPRSRAAVVAWARRRGAYIVEDDYDAEYRYDRAPVGAIQGMAPDRVIYAGTASKTLAPGLRLGWLALPDHLTAAVAAAKTAADRGAPTLDQLAFADFITHGEFDRHLRRMRPVYRGRRDVLLAALRERLPDFTPTGAAAGLHLVAWLPPHLDEATVVAAAGRHGVHIAAVGPYRMAPGRAGLILGYSALGERAIAEGVRLLADAVGELR
jgi:GntR family transcriptional regulator / MocR family aminotransferase